MSIVISLLTLCLIQLKFFPAALTSQGLAWKVRENKNQLILIKTLGHLLILLRSVIEIKINVPSTLLGCWLRTPL